MSPAANPSRPATEALHRLEAHLIQIAEVYRGLLALSEEQRRALSAADHAALAACLVRQEQSIGQLSRLEAERSALVRTLTPLMRGVSGLPEAPTTTALAKHAPEPQRARLLGLAAVVRDLVAQVSQQQAMLRQATESLLAHARGLIQQVGRELSHAGTYARQVRPVLASPVISALDVTR